MGIDDKYSNWQISIQWTNDQPEFAKHNAASPASIRRWSKDELQSLIESSVAALSITTITTIIIVKWIANRRDVTASQR